MTARPSDTIMSIRIRSAENPRDVENMMRYDLPQDAITRALCQALIATMEALAEERSVCAYCGDRI
jgi:hypothetical protein